MKTRLAIITALLFATALTAEGKAEPQAQTDAPKTTKEAPAQEDNELDVTADRMEILLDGRTIELTDNVRFEDQTMILTASRMKIYLEKEDEQKDPPKTDKQENPPKTDKQKPAKAPAEPQPPKRDEEDMKLKRIEADGNVVLRKKIDATESVMGDKAVYEVKTDTVTLSGNCVVTQGGHVMKGKLVTFDRLRQKIQVKQAVITIKLNKGKKLGLGNLLSPQGDADKTDRQGKLKPRQTKEKPPKETKPQESKAAER